MIQEEPWRLRLLARNAALLRAGLQSYGYDTGVSETPIIPVVLGDDETTWKVARQLEDNGILASAVVSPAVPQDAARLRLCTMATHSEEDIHKVVDAMGRLRHSPGGPPAQHRPRVGARAGSHKGNYRP